MSFVRENSKWLGRLYPHVKQNELEFQRMNVFSQFEKGVVDD